MARCRGCNARIPPATDVRAPWCPIRRLPQQIEGYAPFYGLLGPRVPHSDWTHESGCANGLASTVLLRGKRARYCDLVYARDRGRWEAARKRLRPVVDVAAERVGDAVPDGGRHVEGGVGTAEEVAAGERAFERVGVAGGGGFVGDTVTISSWTSGGRSLYRALTCAARPRAADN
jgi:hypothetical protein